MNKTKIKSFIKKKKCTLLCAGPMSVNCVDSIIELSNKHDIPIFLIASRRQIDSSDFGGGYVNNWNTREFANYVKSKDKKGKTILARDHGGPWQNSMEVDKKFSLEMSMESAKHSFKEDIESGFQMLHLDPSIDIHKNLTTDESLERLFELYSFCNDEAKKNSKELIFEIGTEEQSGSTNNPADLQKTLSKVRSFCLRNNFDFPSFVVIQSGSKVLEMKNVGSFDNELRIKNELPPEIQIPYMIDICEKNKIMMKAHNCDYLSEESLKWHPRLGIHAANIAPEFGVTESKALIEILVKNNLKNIADEMIEISFCSKKWVKWMIKNSNTSDFDKGIISCHYIFSFPEFIELKRNAEKELLKKDIVLDDFLKYKIKENLTKYLKSFRLIG